VPSGSADAAASSSGHDDGSSVEGALVHCWLVDVGTNGADATHVEPGCEEDPSSSHTSATTPARIKTRGPPSLVATHRIERWRSSTILDRRSSTAGFRLLEGGVASSGAVIAFSSGGPATR
jgi:hypothetical protein